MSLTLSLNRLISSNDPTEPIRTPNENPGRTALRIPDVVFSLLDVSRDITILLNQYISSILPNARLQSEPAAALLALGHSLRRDFRLIEDRLRTFLYSSPEEWKWYTIIFRLNNVQEVMNKLLCLLRQPINSYEITQACRQVMNLLGLASPLALPHIGESPKKLCLLEQHFQESGIPRDAEDRPHEPPPTVGPGNRRPYALSDFSDWANLIGHKLISSAQIGLLQSVHLFQEKKSIFYHEFILLSFLNDDERTSWLRAERAPNTTSLADGSASTSGCSLLESASFSEQKEDLVDSNYVEFASIEITRCSEKSQSLEKVGRFVLQYLSAAEAKPVYRLFSENCRWFARRNFLLVAEHLKGEAVQNKLCLHGSPTSLDYLKGEFTRTPFGGRQLVSTNTTARNFLNMAWKEYNDASPEKALRKLDEARLAIQKMSRRSPKQQIYYVTALRIAGRIQFDAGNHLDASKTFREALKIAQNVRSTDQVGYIDTLDSLAMSLHKLHSTDEAIKCQKEAIQILRSEPHDVSHDTERLATVLGNFAKGLSGVPGREEEMLEAFTEVIDLHQHLLQNQPMRYQYALGSAMQGYAAALHALKRTEDAITIAPAVVVLAQAVSDFDPTQYRLFLAHSLDDYAAYASELNRWEAACNNGSKSVEQYRILFDEDNAKYRRDLIEALSLWGYNLNSDGNSADARRALEEALYLARVGFEKEGEAYHEVFMHLLDQIGDVEQHQG